MSDIFFEQSLDKQEGILLLSWNMPDRSMNIISKEVVSSLNNLVTQINDDPAIKGVVICSGKPDFSGGADIAMLQTLMHKARELAKAPAPERQALFESTRHLSQLLRRIETGGKPWVAAINGACLGGAFELALACHGRVASAEPHTRIALPEIRIGIFPGAGGTQRVMRMAEPSAGLKFLSQGRMMSAEKAKSAKLIDAVTDKSALIDAAKQMIIDGLSAIKPWDKKGFKLPGGAIYSPAGFQFWPAASAIYRRESQDNYFCARALMSAVYDGLMLPIDLALEVESRYFFKVLCGQEAQAMTRTMFFSQQQLSKGARRPAEAERQKIKKIGVLGAGFMGAGIAYVSAAAGIETVIIDQDASLADKGKSNIEKLAGKARARGKMTGEEQAALLAHVTPSADFTALSACDLIIEAVYEARDIKREVTQKVQAAIGENLTFASNTSTIPITSLAENWGDPSRFLGLHFFSPVERMPLVEIIKGKHTSPETVALGFDYVRQIKKTPIIVNDSRGFYTSRVVMTYIGEGMAMVQEGMPPAMVDRLGKMAGMPVGPLTLADEIALDLAWKIIAVTKKDLGVDYQASPMDGLLEKMVVQEERFGRKNGRGFYDYFDDGTKKIWPGISKIVGPARPASNFDIGLAKQRLLAVQALETARIFEEKCLEDVREADIGSILGFGFAPFTGGTLSYIDGMGADKFVTLCRKISDHCGDRFAPTAQLIEMAQSGEGFYQRFAPEITA